MLKRFYCSCDKQIKKIFNDLNVKVVSINIKKDERPTQKDIESIDKEINKKVKMIINTNNDLIYNFEQNQNSVYNFMKNQNKIK